MNSYEFYKSIKNADGISLRKIIEMANDKKVDVNYENSSGEGNVLFAKTNSALKMNTLIRVGCDVNFENIHGQNALFFQNSGPVVRELLNAGTNPDKADSCGQTPIFFAESIEVFKLLIESGAKINHKDKWDKNVAFYIEDPIILDYAISVGLNTNLRNDQDNSALSGMNILKNADMVEIFLKSDFDLSKDKKTVLFNAAYQKDVPERTFQLLIEGGADIYAENEYGQTIFAYVTDIDKLHTIFRSVANPVYLDYKSRSGKTILEQFSLQYQIIDLIESDVISKKMLLSPYLNERLIDRVAKLYSSLYGKVDEKIAILREKSLLEESINIGDKHIKHNRL